MSEHKARIEWRNDSDTLAYKTYTRDHVLSFHSHQVPASAAPEYLGSEARVDPEELYVASLSSCHMLTFLAIAAKRRLVVDRYVDNAVGYMQKNENGFIQKNMFQDIVRKQRKKDGKILQRMD
mgnify:CR=1 FL=1